MSKVEDLQKKKEIEYMNKAIGEEEDPVMLILKAHLFTESALERLLILELKRGDKLAEKGNLSYAQKLAVVESLDIIPDAVISSLRQLNKLRNGCAHELNKTISVSDITKIGSPLGSEFTLFKRNAQYSDNELLKKVVDYVCAYIIGFCAARENIICEAQRNEPNDKDR